MDMEGSQMMNFSIANGVAQSTDGVLTFSLHPPQSSSGQRHHLQEEDDEAAADQLFSDNDRASDNDDDDDQDNDDDDDMAIDPEPGYPTEEDEEDEEEEEEEIVQDPITILMILNLLAAQGMMQADFETVGGVVVPASDAAVAALQKQAFHAEDCTGCAICLEDFEDGEEVTVMPCSRGHEFHPDCIEKWLGKSNTCPLCRHALPTDDAMDDA